jgi:hypothetical protein
MKIFVGDVKPLCQLGRSKTSRVCDIQASADLDERPADAGVAPARGFVERGVVVV